MSVAQKIISLPRPFRETSDIAWGQGSTHEAILARAEQIELDCTDIRTRLTRSESLTARLGDEVNALRVVVDQMREQLVRQAGEISRWRDITADARRVSLPGEKMNRFASRPSSVPPRFTAPAQTTTIKTGASSPPTIAKASPVQPPRSNRLFLAHDLENVEIERTLSRAGINIVRRSCEHPISATDDGLALSVDLASREGWSILCARALQDAPQLPLLATARAERSAVWFGTVDCVVAGAGQLRHRLKAIVDRPRRVLALSAGGGDLSELRADLDRERISLTIALEPRQVQELMPMVSPDVLIIHPGNNVSPVFRMLCQLYSSAAQPLPAILFVLDKQTDHAEMAAALTSACAQTAPSAVHAAAGFLQQVLRLAILRKQKSR